MVFDILPLMYFRWKAMYSKQSQAGHEISPERHIKWYLRPSWKIRSWKRSRVEIFWLPFNYKYIWVFLVLLFSRCCLHCADNDSNHGFLSLIDTAQWWRCNWLLNKSRGIGHTGGVDPSALLGAGIIIGIIRTHRCSFIKKVKKKRKNPIAIA